MKKTFVWMQMLSKRQLKRLSFWLILLCMIVSTVLLRYVAVNFAVNIQIGVFCEESKDASDEQMAKRICQLMTEHKGMVKFIAYEDEESLKNAVLTSEIYAGYVLKRNMWEKVQNGDIKNCIHAVATPDSFVPKIANELVYSYVMQEYTYEVLVFDTYETGYFDEYDKEKIGEDLRNYYMKNLTNGSTFSVDYSGEVTANSRVELNVFDYISPVIKGLVGVLIFLAGLCGTILVYHDKEEKTFCRFTALRSNVLYLVEIAVPALGTGIVGALCLHLSGIYTGSVSQYIHILGYLLLVIGYCFGLSKIIRNKVIFLSFIPIFTMASLLFCHVFLNLSAIVPQLRYVAMLLPPNYF